MRTDHLTDLIPLDSGHEDWQDQARCAQSDPEAFFPEKGESPADAKRVCRSCPVIEACLRQALINDEQFGVWGGLAPNERRALTRTLRAAS